MTAGLRIQGDAALVRRHGPALMQSLGAGRLCAVHLFYVGRGGDILLSLDGPLGHVPVILRPADQLPDRMAQVGRALLERVSN